MNGRCGSATRTCGSVSERRSCTARGSGRPSAHLADGRRRGNATRHTSSWERRRRWQRSFAVKVQATGSEADQADEAEQSGPKKYYAVVANAKFLLSEEEHFAEQLRERKRYLRELGSEPNFWIVPEPNFVHTNPEPFKNVGRPCAALVSTDPVWTRFMKLRLDKVLFADLGECSPEQALSSKSDVEDFPKPERWTAPYMQYTPGWWRVFVPKEAASVVKAKTE